MSSIKAQVSLPAGLDITKASIRRALNNGMRAMGVRAYHFWKSLADKELTTSYQEYVGSIELSFAPDMLGLDAAFIGIHGFLPMAVEFGSDSYDMKSRLHGGPRTQRNIFDRPRAKVRTAKNGMRYAIIPMRHATQGSAGDRRMHVPPPPIQKMMSKGSPVRGVRGYHTVSRATGYRSAVPRYEGMVKTPGYQAAHKRQTAGWYTFRTMTENQSQAWIHSGFKARMLHERVLEYVERTLVPEIMEPLFKLLQT